jgi:hypothetical protein
MENTRAEIKDEKRQSCFSVTHHPAIKAGWHILEHNVAETELEPEQEPREPYHFATIRTGARTVILLWVLVLALVSVPAPVQGINRSQTWV